MADKELPDWEKRMRREHYEKYRAFATHVPPGFTAIILNMTGETAESMAEAYAKDRHLNNVALRYRDAMHQMIKQFFPRGNYTLCETVCTAKWIATYRIVNAEPPPEEWAKLEG